jgi:soluble P-type ATPase
MIEVEIPGSLSLRIEHLVLDYNGTLAVDGALVPGVTERLEQLASRIQVHVVTADTFGRAAAALEALPCSLTILPAGAQDQAKLAHVQRLDPARCACVGNGSNDRLMLEAAALGVVVILSEGASGRAVTAADVVCTSILDALDLLQHPLRLAATLRC